jgi:hypothetical protein
MTLFYCPVTSRNVRKATVSCAWQPSSSFSHSSFAKENALRSLSLHSPNRNLERVGGLINLSGFLADRALEAKFP